MSHTDKVCSDGVRTWHAWTYAEVARKQSELGAPSDGAFVRDAESATNLDKTSKLAKSRTEGSTLANAPHSLLRRCTRNCRLEVLLRRRKRLRLRPRLRPQLLLLLTLPLRLWLRPQR